MFDGSPLITKLNRHDDNNEEQENVPRDESTSTGIDTPLTATYQRTSFLRRNELAPESHNMSLISPRSGNYERLEGGMGPSRIKSKRFAWKKIAIGVGLLVTLVYFFGPRESKSLWKEPTEHEPELEHEHEHDNTHEEALDSVPPHHAQHATSFKSDPDPSKTTYCTTAHSPEVPLVDYALMIDAGSTGSRIHIYKFNNCATSPQYEYETFKMLQGGLSSYAGKPEEAARSLDVLMEEAVRVVPESLHKCTPVSVKATAGLRLLPGNQSNDILTAVEHRLKTSYPFPLKSAVVMDGTDEGVYAWITANYLLHSLDAKAKDPGTYAVLDLGGASTQIVFKPSFDKSKPTSELHTGEHKYDLKFGGKQHTLYQNSYLGYGLMKVRQHVHQLVEFMHSVRAGAHPDVSTTSPKLSNPCLSAGTTREIDIEDKDTKRPVVMDGADIGNYESCQRIMELVLAKDAVCEVKPCSFNGVYQPSIMDTFPTGKIMLLSYFYDRIKPLMPTDIPPPHGSSVQASAEPSLKVKISEIATLAKEVCKGHSAWKAHPTWGNNPHVMEELEGRPEWCLDLTFMHTLLRLGYGFDDSREVILGKRIDGTELGWALGAGIELVGAKVQCLA